MGLQSVAGHQACSVIEMGGGGPGKRLVEATHNAVLNRHRSARIQSFFDVGPGQAHRTDRLGSRICNWHHASERDAQGIDSRIPCATCAAGYFKGARRHLRSDVASDDRRASGLETDYSHIPLVAGEHDADFLLLRANARRLPSSPSRKVALQRDLSLGRRRQSAGFAGIAVFQTCGRNVQPLGTRERANVRTWRFAHQVGSRADQSSELSDESSDLSDAQQLVLILIQV
jgi:hypothetical protein